MIASGTIIGTTISALYGAPPTGLLLPECTGIKPVVSVGKGSGSMTIDGNTVKIEAKADELGKYAVNWTMDAAVMDFYLPKGTEISRDCERLSMKYVLPPVKDCQVELRVLVKDSRDGVWAVGTRVGPRWSQLQFTPTSNQIETYAWNTSECGRIDPWVMMSLSPERFDEYDAPKPPMRLLGFRIALTGKSDITLTISDIFGSGAGTVPDPYWNLSNDNEFTVRIQKPANASRPPPRFGWGPSEPAPYLKAADLGLPPGKYTVNWEILGLKAWDVVKSGSQEMIVAKDGDSRIYFPLMDVGDWRMHLFITKDNSKDIKERFLTCTVIRNANGTSGANDAKLPKPLSVSTANPAGNMFSKGTPVVLNVKVIGEYAEKNGLKLAFSAESSDGRTFLKDEIPVEGKISVDLSAAAAKESVLWLKFDLMENGRVIDSSRRVIGVKDDLATPITGIESKASKESKFRDAVMRTKGDWFEGSTPLISHAGTLDGEFSKWMDEAKLIGYNMVELPATWYELEPLPGIYQLEYLDRYVKMAEGKGLSVVLRVHPRLECTPSWIPRRFQENQDGFAHGLWGGTTNLVSSPASPELIDAYHKFLKKLSEHYRNDPEMIGYSLAHTYFDHVFFTEPWVGQFVDYSEAMRQGFIRSLKKKYSYDMESLRKAHGINYSSWEAVRAPLPEVKYDNLGRLKPRKDALWHDWIEQMLHCLTVPFEKDAVAALRAGDPACMALPYSSQAREFNEHLYPELQVGSAQGSMERQFPYPVLEYPVRFEPIAKVSRGAQTADVGITNVLFERPGFNTFYNYWFPEWKIDSVTPDIRDAEKRLAQWFKVVDRIAGAEPITVNNGGENGGIMINSLETLVYTWQHLHGSRAKDYSNLYSYAAGKDGIQCMTMTNHGMSQERLKKYSYVIIPFGADTFTSGQIDTLRKYVENGGKLILEATSGLWKIDDDKSNALAVAFGLPAPIPLEENPKASSEEAKTTPDELLKGVPLKFRLANYKPPINDQPMEWIHCALRQYFRACRFEKKIPAGIKVVATFNDGAPAALLSKFGKGEVLQFCGTVEWPECPGLALRLDRWGRGEACDAKPAESPEILSCQLEKDGKRYVLGRRFVPDSMLIDLKTGKMPPNTQTLADLKVKFSKMGDGKYRVAELVSGKTFNEMTGGELEDGVTLSLKPGEGFLLEAAPQK